MEMGLRETDARRAAELRTEVVEFREEVLQTFHLHHRTREAVDDCSADVFRGEQLAEENLHHFAVTHEHTGVDALLGFGAREQVADHNRVGGVVAVLEDERRVRALTGARGAVKPEDLAGEGQLLAPDFAFQTGPDRIKNDLAILDLKVTDAGAGGSGLSVAHEVKGLGVNHLKEPARQKSGTAAPFSGNYFFTPLVWTSSDPGFTTGRPGSLERFRRN